MLQLSATPVQWLLIQLGRPAAAIQAQVPRFTALSWGLLALDVLVGLLILGGRWRRATTRLGSPIGPQRANWNPASPPAETPLG